MKEIKLLILFMVIFLSAINLVNAESAYIFKQGDDVDLCIDIYNNDNSPATASTTCYLTIKAPNMDVLLDGKTMTYDSSGLFCYYIDKGNFTRVGGYPTSVRCDDGADYGFSSFQVEITPTGGQLSSGKATTYIIVFVIGFIVFIGLLLMGLYLPSGNRRDEMTGYILAISNLKYLKLVFLAFAYLVALVIAYFAYILSYAYLDFDFLTNLFRFLFYAEAIFTLPLFILFTYLTITNLIRDSKIKDFLMRGLRTR